jgi:hypothetical protein
MTFPRMKIDVSTSLNVRVDTETKERAMRIRSFTGESLPKLTALAWEKLEADVLAKMTVAERQRYLAA